MKHERQSEGEYKYFAFISYSRKDVRVASWLHKKLEKYPYPEDAVHEDNRPEGSKFIRKVFIDKKDLTVNHHKFTESIQAGLREARYLIVLCSDNSARSEFVQKETAFFLSCHNEDTSLVLPVFIDRVSEDLLPAALQGKGILERNCPIFNSQVAKRKESNLYCFYQVASFLLKVDFLLLYNRYEQHKRRKMWRNRFIYSAFVLLLVGLIAILASSLKKESRLRETQQELTEFEKSIFPLSVVLGYEKNFLTPVITYLKEQQEPFEIFVLMPTSYRDLMHKERITRVTERICNRLPVDSIYLEELPTSMKRGSKVGRLALKHPVNKRIYLDFASTTTTFTQIIDYKRKRYPDIQPDEGIYNYSRTFVRQCNELLAADSVYVHFYFGRKELINGLGAAMKEGR